MDIWWFTCTAVFTLILNGNLHHRWVFRPQRIWLIPRKARLHRWSLWWAEPAGSGRGRSELPKTRASSSFLPSPPPLRKGDFRQGCDEGCLCWQSLPGKSNIIDVNGSIDNCVDRSYFYCQAFTLRVCCTTHLQSTSNTVSQVHRNCPFSTKTNSLGRSPSSSLLVVAVIREDKPRFWNVAHLAPRTPESLLLTQRSQGKSKVLVELSRVLVLVLVPWRSELRRGKGTFLAVLHLISAGAFTMAMKRVI